MKYFKLFANCLICKGVNRSLICDLQRRNSIIISNDLVEIIEKLNNKISIDDIHKFYGMDNHETINGYINYLNTNEFGFFCDSIEEFDNFPDLTTDFVEPKKITNSIIEFSNTIENKLDNIIKQLNELHCKSLILFLYEEINIDKLMSIINCFDETRICSIEIITKYHKKINDFFLRELNSKLTPITKIIFYNSPFDKSDRWDKEILFDRVFTTKNINSFKYCGIVDTKYFNTNFPKILEAVNHNSCLHKKISIDIEGNIRNCPSMPQSFGNIKDTTLEEALNHPDFKKYWNLTKDNIEVCKDCEFRYICTDCRAYTERTHTNQESLDTSKPLKCGYNPYTGEWEEWSTNPLKQKSIEFYGMQELIKNNG